mgnify:CR=1 FL=1
MRKKKFFKNIFNFYKKKKIIPNIDLHVHTNWTDGKHTEDVMVDSACKKNIEALFFCEHSRKTSKGWFNKFAKEIKNCRKKIKNKCKLFIGTEVKIEDFDGSLDISPKIRKKSDLIMASVHRFPGEKGNIFKSKPNISKKEAIEIEYRLTLNAIKNSKFDVVGHPFGMSIKRFKAKPKWVLFQKLITECKKYDKVFEINFHYHKNYRKLLNECVKNNTLFSLGSNAHEKKELGKIIEI